MDTAEVVSYKLLCCSVMMFIFQNEKYGYIHLAGLWIRCLRARYYWAIKKMG